MPDKIEDEETHKRALDLYKMCRVALRNADGTRKMKRNPYPDIPPALQEAQGPMAAMASPIDSRVRALRK